MTPDKPSLRERQTILYIDHSMKIGGASKVLINLINELNSRDTKPVVVCPTSSDLISVLKEQHTSVAPTFMPWFTKRSGPFTWCIYAYSIISFFFFLRRQIKLTRALLIHANGFIAGIYSIIPAKLLRIPLIWHMHDVLEPGFVNGVFIKTIGRNAHRIICVSEAVKKRLIEFGVNDKKCRVIYNFLPQPTKSTEQSRHDFLADYHIPENARIIGMIGNISPMKGQIIFLESIGRMAHKHPDVFYFIVGDTLTADDEPYKVELLRMVKASGLGDKIIFTGYRKDAFRILKRFDFLVHSVTLPDSFPLVIQEAMYHGKAVIASNIGGIPEMIVNGASGYLVPPGDSSRLAEAIDELLRMPDVCSALGREGKRILSEKFGREQIIKNLNSIYNELLSERLHMADRIFYGSITNNGNKIVTGPPSL